MLRRSTCNNLSGLNCLYCHEYAVCIIVIRCLATAVTAHLRIATVDDIVLSKERRGLSCNVFMCGPRTNYATDYVLLCFVLIEQMTFHNSLLLEGSYELYSERYSTAAIILQQGGGKGLSEVKEGFSTRLHLHVFQIKMRYG